jgi:hypothetical protein
MPNLPRNPGRFGSPTRMSRNFRHSSFVFAARAALVCAAVMTLVATGWGQTYFNMSSGDYTNQFASITNWPVNFNGTATNATGSIPSATRITTASTTLTTNASPTSTGIYANSNLIFLTTGTTDSTVAVAADLNLNFSGRAAGALTAAVAANANSTGNRVSTLRAYYSTDGSAWTELTGTGLPFLATNNVAGSASINISLPSALNNQSAVKIRFYSHNGSGGTTGSRPRITLDNLGVTSTSIAPAITGAATATAFATTYGTASTAQSFSVSGSNLTANLVATAPTGFEVSSDGTTYGGTATFTQTSGSASGTLRVRLAATAAVSGAYNSQNIVLSSTGATSVNITTASSGNSVTARGLTITGLSAANKNWDGTTTASVTGTPAYSGLANSESFSVTGSVTWAFPDANVGSNKTLTRTGNYDAPSANYTVTQPTLTASINAVAPSAPSITGVTAGDAQLSVAFTAPSSNGGATITNYEYSTNGGTTWTTPSPAITSSPLAITGLVNGTTYDVQLRAVNSAGSGTATATTQATPVAPASPTITALPAVLGPALSTTYGTPSATQSFTVLGATLSGNLTVTAPAGLQVSTNSSTGFASSLELVATSGSVSSTTIYARLTATASAGSYNGQDISVSGGGATTQNVATAASGNTVAQAPLTITGISISNKVYDGNTTATIAGTAAYSGLVNGETFSITGTPAANFADKTVADVKSVTVSGYEAPSANYSITQPAGLTANITPKALTVSDAVAANKVYDATTTATITGTLSGVVSGDTVTLSSTGTFASADVGTGIVVTSTGTLGGADAVNYTLTQPTGLTANITQATQTITFGALSNVTAGTTNALTATASSGLAVTYTSSNTNVASISGTNVIANAAGVTTITASQAGNANVAAATPVSRTLNVAGSSVSTNMFSENMGSPSGTTSIASNTFQNNATLTYSNGGQTNSADVRATSTSSGYAGASGGGNVFFTSTSGAYGFSIDSINASAFGSLQLSYAYRKESGSAHAALSVDYWNGTAWVTLANTAADLFSEAANATGAWYAARTLSLPSAAQINGLRIRFVKTGSVAIRIDDVRLAGTPNASAITPSGNFAGVSTTYGTASEASASTAIVTGGSLTSNITATPPVGFEVSTNGSAWSSNAVFTQTDGFVNGTLYLRLAANAAAGSYSGRFVALVAGSVSNSIVVSNSTVNRYPITVGAVATNKVYGAADPLLAYTNAPLLFNDTFSGGITRAAGTNVGAYTIEQGTLTNANYDITFLTNTFTIDPKALTITADNVTKAAGATLTTPQTGSTAFTSGGLVSGESISSVTITYTDGAGSDAAAGSYPGAVVPSDPVGIDTNNYSITFNAGDLTVDAAPTITVGASSLSAFTTIYGTDSSAQNFTVTGGNLTGDVTVAAPAGFQVSTNASADFDSSVLLTAAANAVPSTTIYVRVPGTANASTNLSGNISVTSDGATTRNVSIATSTVSPKTLSIDGLSATNRVYDATTNGTVSGTPVYVGLTNSQTFEVTNNVIWSFANKNVDTNKALAASASFTAPSANYTIASQPSFSANITQATLTLSGAAATSRAYAAGNTNVTITGTLSGVFPGDTVGFTGTGYIASANAGTNIPVTANVILTGADAGNYSLTQPTDLTVDITKASNTITFGALSNVTVGTTNALTATASSGLAVTYTSSNTNVATIAGTNVVAVAAGVTTITASQAGDSNFDAATPVAQSLTVNAGPTVLAAGDIAILTYNGDDPDEFSFVTLVDLNPGTVIHFTDNGFASATTGRTGEGFLTFTVPSGTTYTAGTVFKWTSGMTVTGTPWSSGAPTSFAFSSTADQLFAFQGSTSNWATQSSISLVAGLIQKTTWLTSGTASATSSYKPSGLDESYIVSLATENGYFANGTSTAATVTVSGTKEQLLALFDDGATKWHNNATGPLTSPTYTISITQAQTITFGALSAVTYGDAPFALTATASSGLAVTYTSSNPAVATIDGSTVTIVGAGSTTITASQGGNATFAAATPVARTLTVNAAGLAGGDITLTPVGDGSYTASGPAGSTFSISYGGRSANGITTTYSSATAPTAAGYYTATATATGNYTGSNSSNFFVTGPIAANDAVSKIAAETAIVIEGSSLLTNDRRIDASGNVQTGGLALSGATAGVGNAVQLDGADVLFEIVSGASPWTFTYTLTDTVANKTTTATVTVSDGATEQPFSLQIVRIGSAAFDGTNTSVTHDFVGVPNQTYLIEYSTDLASWTSAGNQSTGASGSFAVTISRAGNFASAWNSAMFFRARLVTP